MTGLSIRLSRMFSPLSVFLSIVAPGANGTNGPGTQDDIGRVLIHHDRLELYADAGASDRSASTLKLIRPISQLSLVSTPTRPNPAWNVSFLVVARAAGPGSGHSGQRGLVSSIVQTGPIG